MDPSDLTEELDDTADTQARFALSSARNYLRTHAYKSSLNQLRRAERLIAMVEDSDRQRTLLLQAHLLLGLLAEARSQHLKHK